MMTAEDIRHALRDALIYSFQVHGYDHEKAVEFAEIAIGPCWATIDLCQRIIQLQLEAAAITLRKDQP